MKNLTSKGSQMEAGWARMARGINPLPILNDFLNVAKHKNAHWASLQTNPPTRNLTQPTR